MPVHFDVEAIIAEEEGLIERENREDRERLKEAERQRTKKTEKRRVLAISLLKEMQKVLGDFIEERPVQEKLSGLSCIILCEAAETEPWVYSLILRCGAGRWRIFYGTKIYTAKEPPHVLPEGEYYRLPLNLLVSLADVNAERLLRLIIRALPRQQLAAA